MDINFLHDHLAPFFKNIEHTNFYVKNEAPFLKNSHKIMEIICGAVHE